MLRIVDARKRYGDTIALDGCSLEVRRGEWLGVLGPNGAGKTSLIRAIAGRVRLDGGTIELFGATLTGTPRDRAVRRRLGIVPQELALYASLSARENLDAFAALHGLRGAARRERVAWALEFTALADRADDRVAGFSGGMKRRLNIACGVLHRPELILLDEPTVGVDPQSRQRIWEMLASLRAAGASLLLTTHQLDEAQQLCDRIVIVDHGRAIASGTLHELVAATVGRHHEVTLRLVAEPGSGSLPESMRLEGLVARGRLGDVGAELPALLEGMVAAGCAIEDVHIAAPSLHAVFIALTGRELRE